MIRLPEHIAVVLIEMAKRSTDSKTAIFEAEIVERLSNQFGIECNHSLVEDALEILQQIGGCKKLLSPLTGPYYQISVYDASYYFGNYPTFQTDRGDEDYDAEAAYATARGIMHDQFPVVATYYSADSRWFEAVLAKLVDMDMSREYFLEHGSLDQAEADDIIEVPDTPQVRDIRDGLAELENEVLRNNETGQIFGDDRVVVAAEISSLRQLLSAGRVRVSTLVSHARRTLGWIAEKGAGAAVAELAKKLLNLIIGAF